MAVHLVSPLMHIGQNRCLERIVGPLRVATMPNLKRIKRSHALVCLARVIDAWRKTPQFWVEQRRRPHLLKLPDEEVALYRGQPAYKDAIPWPTYQTDQPSFCESIGLFRKDPRLEMVVGGQMFHRVCLSWHNPPLFRN